MLLQWYVFQSLWKCYSIDKRPDPFEGINQWLWQEVDSTIMSTSPPPTAKKPRMDPHLANQHHGQVAMDPAFYKTWLDKGKTFFSNQERNPFCDKYKYLRKEPISSID